jgi:hypothetical protein
MKANQLLKFLQDVEQQVNSYGRTLEDVEVNFRRSDDSFRRSDDSDIEQTDFVGVDLFDEESNKIVESIVIMGKY